MKVSKRAGPAVPVEAGATLGAVARVDSLSGYIDLFGHSSAAGGWLFSGWVSRPPRTDWLESVDFLAQYAEGQSRGRATLAFYQREDLARNAIGVIAFAPGNGRVTGGLQSVEFSLDGVVYRAHAGHTTARLHDQDLVDHVRPSLLNRAFANRTREHLLAITSRRAFAGEDTLTSLSEPVLIEIDEAIVCPPDGVLLKGWHLSGAGIVRALRVRSGALTGELTLADSICVPRPDVIDVFGPRIGFSDVRCGFIAYVPCAISWGEVSYLEIELHNGEVGFKKLKLSMRAALDAIRSILEGIDVGRGEINRAFDNVLGPAVCAINTQRLRNVPPAAQIDFGRAPSRPICSLIIPLYGRVDFMEYQIALFSQHAGMESLDIIYVLDDPARGRELEALAHSVFERFQIPFRVLCLTVNLGFGPASNVGLGAAQGEFVCFLNSDVFPMSGDWIERLVERLRRHPEIGLIGPRLLFEDGSIQHDGCFYRQIPQFGNWSFIEHCNKGRRPGPSQGLRECDVITGACMVLKRSLALQLGGFDEAYVVGDFEDSDLCLRVKKVGLRCMIDDTVQLYHLERKSQEPPSRSWRMNLTLYNAWLHQRRWCKAASLAGPGAGPTCGV
jgi:O-antigen biosynthesis protein